jgi:hypothetical protein
MFRHRYQQSSARLMVDVVSSILTQMRIPILFSTAVFEELVQGQRAECRAERGHGRRNTDDLGAAQLADDIASIFAAHAKVRVNLP